MRGHLTDRFWDKVSRPEGCWKWTGVKNQFGYGRLRTGKSMIVAHRVSWQIHNGPIPKGMSVLHKCDNPECTNPEHLFLGTYSDNAKDMVAKKRHNMARKTHCKRDHSLSGENLKIDTNNNRQCKKCNALRAKKWRDKNEERISN